MLPADDCGSWNHALMHDVPRNPPEAPPPQEPPPGQPEPPDPDIVDPPAPQQPDPVREPGRSPPAIAGDDLPGSAG